MKAAVVIFAALAACNPSAHQPAANQVAESTRATAPPPAKAFRYDEANDVF